MTKLSRQNVGGIDYTMVGCTLTGVCASAASDYVKAVTLSDGDILSDGMSVVITFANGNTAGTAPASLTIYSSDQVNYYSDSGLTQPFTLAPSGCYEIEYTGTGNAYTYTSYPVIQIEGVTAPLCDSCGKKTSGAVWDAGDTVLMLYSGNKFMAISGLTEVVTAGSKKAVTSGAVADAIDSLGITNVGSTSFQARRYTNIANNTEYEFADITAVADITNAIISISTYSSGNVCGSTWLVSIGNTGQTCGITLLNKSGYGGNNKTLLKVNFNAGGNCSLVLKLSSLGQWSANGQSGYISILCLNGKATLKEKTTTQTSRSFTKFLETDRLDGNLIATDALIQATVTQSKKVSTIGSVAAASTRQYYKISGLMVTNTENVFLLQSRAGELLILSCGYGDNGGLVPPKIKRILNVHTKIEGFTYSGSDVFMRVAAYAHDCVFSQLAGLTVASLTITDATEAQYNAGTPITIET